MVRSIWMKSLMAALASTGLAVAQQVTDVHVGDVVGASEKGKPSRKCTVVDFHHNVDGSCDYTLKDTVTGEVFRLHELGKGEKPGNVMTSRTEPVAAPPASPTPVAASTPVPAAADADELVIHEEHRGPQRARIVQTWTTESGQKAYLAQFIESKQKVTIVEAAKRDGSGDKTAAVSCQFYHWRSSESPSGAPVPPGTTSPTGPDGRWTSDQKPSTEIKVPPIGTRPTAPPSTASTGSPSQRPPIRTGDAHATQDLTWSPSIKPDGQPWVSVKPDTTPKPVASAPAASTGPVATMTVPEMNPPPPLRTSSGSGLAQVPPVVDAKGSGSAAPKGSTAPQTTTQPKGSAPQTVATQPKGSTTPAAAPKGSSSAVATQPATQLKGSGSSATAATQPKGSGSAAQASAQPKGSSSASQVVAAQPKGSGSTAAVAKGSAPAQYAHMDPQQPRTADASKGSGSKGSADRSDPLLKAQDYNAADIERRLGSKGSGSAAKPADVATGSRPSSGSGSGVVLPPEMTGSTTRASHEKPVAVASKTDVKPNQPGVEYMTVPTTSQPNKPVVPPVHSSSQVPASVAAAQAAAPQQPAPTTGAPVPPIAGAIPPVPPQSIPVDVENAFTRTMPGGKGQQQQPSPVAGNAFTTQPQAGPQQPAYGPYAMGGQRPMAYGMTYNPQMGVMQPGSMPMMPFNGTATPAVMTQQQMMQASYYQRPNMPMTSGMPMTMPVYGMPPALPPIVTPAPQSTGGAPGVAQVSSTSGPVSEGALPSREGMSVAQMTHMLREAMYPSHRTWAADQLGSVDARANPNVVNDLMQAASEDPCNTVRASAVHSLARMNANQPAVLRVLQGLRTDVDPMVHTEVEKALARLAPNGIGADVVPVKADQR